MTDADLTISADDDELVVAVTDAGVGFVPSETETPHLGLRHSVLARVEGVGGSVRVWSTPGTGTSVVIAMPTSAAAHDDVREMPASASVPATDAATS